MKMKLLRIKTLAILLILSLALGLTTPAYAGTARVLGEGEAAVTVEKLSSPYRGEGLADGLLGQDRNTSAVCCMTELDGKIFLGTGRGLAELLLRRLSCYGGTEADLPEGTLRTLAEQLWEGAVPEAPEDLTGTILVYDRLSGRLRRLPEADAVIRAGCAVRDAFVFAENVYFLTSDSERPGCGAAQLLRLDRDGHLTELYAVEAGSLSAACIFGNEIYLAGAGDSDGASQSNVTPLTVLRQSGDSGAWTPVADVSDFGAAAMDLYVCSDAFAPFCALYAYEDAIYAALPGWNGFSVFRGRPAAESETANAYGWFWQELVGRENGVNAPGLCDDPRGYVTGEEPGVEQLCSVFCGLVEFDGALYLYDADLPVLCSLHGAEALSVLNGEGEVTDLLDPLCRTLLHPQRVWRLDGQIGTFTEETALTQLNASSCVDAYTCAQAWKDAFYLGTRDDTLLYDCLTRLKTGAFLHWDESEWQQTAEEIEAFQELLSDPQLPEHTTRFLGEILNAIELLLKVVDPSQPVDEATMQYILRNWDLILGNIAELLRQLWEDTAADGARYTRLRSGGPAPTGGTQDVLSYLDSLLEKLQTLFDFDAVAKYLLIRVRIARNDAGFDLLRTEDGVQWERFCGDGLNDRYNGGLTGILAAEDGLYYGTQNPYYGAQLWRMRDGVDPLLTCGGGEDCPIRPYTDTDAALWYHDGIHYCLEQGLMNGVSATRFAPTGLTSRAQIVTILWRLEGCPEPQSRDSDFADLLPGSYYATAVLWAQETGVVNGTSPTCFSPNASVTREQLAVMLYRYARYRALEMTAADPLEEYQDRADAAEWALPALQWAVAHGVINGVGDTTLDPTGFTSRAQVATMLMRFCRSVVDNGTEKD